MGLVINQGEKERALRVFHKPDDHSTSVRMPEGDASE